MASCMDAVLGIFDPEKSKAVEFAIRLEAAEALGRVGDPRINRSSSVKISACNFNFGGSVVKINAFEIGVFPVSVAEFKNFLQSDDCMNEREWTIGKGPANKQPLLWEEQLLHPNGPVTGVDWYEATAYCSWVGARLPTEAEWRRAAYGLGGRQYPWGDEKPDENRATYEQGSPGNPTPVGLYPERDALRYS